MKKLIAVISMVLGLAFGLKAQDLDAQYASDLLKVGKKAPELALKDLDGNMVKLSSFRGKYVALVFWASWCPDCRAEVPMLKEMYSKADPDKVVFVSVSFDRTLDAVKEFVREQELPGVQLFDPSGKKDSPVSAAFHIKWIPSLYLIGPNGKIVLSTVMAQKLDAALQNLK